MKPIKTTDCAFLAGMIMGWKMVLESKYEKEIDRQNEFHRVTKDMHDIAKKLAKLGGVTYKI